MHTPSPPPPTSPSPPLSPSTPWGSLAPAPTAQRWKPLRLGLVNLFKYDDQVFVFEDGHLLLRGDNGTGKSRVLALTLPFLYDGRALPGRVEPDGDAAKSLAWNLLLDHHPRRTGYAWAEFGRVDPDGTPRFCTLLAGLEAVKGRPGVESWFGVTDRRVGSDLAIGEDVAPGPRPLSLLRGREALSRADFKQALGEGFSRSAEGHRTRVNRALFGLPADRYAALVDLLIELRRPQLSRDWSERRMAELLDQSLRQVPEEVLATAARAFEGLEEQKRQLADLTASARDAEAFSRVYRGYARAAARRRAEPVRRSHARYEEAARTARQARREALAAEEAFATAEAERATATTEGAAARQAAEELRRDPAMRTVERLRELREVAVAAKARETEAGARARKARERQSRMGELLDQASARLESRADRAAESARELARAAVPAALAEAHAAAEAGIAPDAAAATHDAGVRRLEAQAQSRREAARRLQKLESERLRASDAVERRRTAEAAQRGRVETAAAEAAAAATAVERVGRVYLDGLRAWAQPLEELRVDTEELVSAARQWVRGVAASAGSADAEAGRGSGPVRRLLASAAAASRAPLAEAQAQAQARATARGEEAAEAAAEIARLEAGHHPPPPRPHTRAPDARQADRPGAPLWQLLDFRGEHAADAHRASEAAGLEAALEAAGLLDAWVEPDGQPLGEAFDASLARAAVAPEPGGRTLADRLVVLPEAAAAAGVDPAGLSAFLSTIALLDRKAEASPAWIAVSLDGGYRHGGLRGRWAKPAVAHLGESARAAERLRRIATLREAQAAAERARAQAVAEVEQLRRRSATIDQELGQAPTPDQLNRAVGSAATAADRLGRERAALVESEEAVRAAEKALAQAAAALATAAASAGLERELHRLPELTEAIGDFVRALGLLADHARERREALAAWESARDEDLRARDDTQAAERAATAAGLEATAADSARATLEEASGADAREIERRLGVALDAVRASDARRARAQAAVEAAIARRSAASEKRDSAESQRLQDEAARERAIEALRALTAEGFLDAADPPKIHGNSPDEAEPEADQADQADQANQTKEAADREPNPLESATVRGRLADAAPDPAEPWSAKRGVELARRIEASIDEPTDIDAFNRVAKRLQEAFHELKERLGARNDDASLEQVLEDGLLRARVRVGSDDRPVHEVVATLTAEILHRNQVLSAEEQQVIQNHLIGEAGQALVECIHAARQLVADMSAELSARTTATGMRLRFRWQLDPEDPALATTRAAVELLEGTVLRLRPKQRDALGSFLQTRIDEARSGEPSAGWLACLTKALDYRLWHRFTLDVRKDDGSEWEPVNRRTFGRRSGGEKALLLTMPQFAAAAAHHRASKGGPRLVLLDEAFAGIDPGNRAGCMELIREFDLDFVMTSDRETGCYPALAGNAIYHLSTRPGSMAVLATRQVWNGSAATRPPDHGPAHAEPPEEAAPASGLFADASPRDTDPPADDEDDDDAWEEAP